MPINPVLPAPLAKTAEEAMDALAYLLSTDSRTAGIDWILGDPGMGNTESLPFGYISKGNQAVKWMTANGGSGGLGAGGVAGLDDWQIPIVLTICTEEHRFRESVLATPSAGSAFAGLVLGYMESPGWRDLMVLAEAPILDVLRQNIVVGGYLATTQVTESRPILVNINDKLYRAQRITVAAQQRRQRGT